MGTAEALWEGLAKAANFAQATGLTADMLVTVVMSLLRIPQSGQECAKLEHSTRKLREVLQWPTLCESVMQPSGMLDLVNMSLNEAACLIDCFNTSSIWCRIQRSRSMESQFVDMRIRIDSYYDVVLSITGSFLIQAIHPQSDAM